MTMVDCKTHYIIYATFGGKVSRLTSPIGSKAALFAYAARANTVKNQKNVQDISPKEIDLLKASQLILFT